jgi:NAD(P)-dependent dehydrogenase (short-subunit alcohol dehydrogenase family)
MAEPADDESVPPAPAGSETIARVCVVTGAGAGLGQAIAERFAAAGHTVCIVDRDLERAQAVTAKLQAEGTPAYAHRVDVSKEDEVERLADELRERHGRVDVLVNNAGIAMREGSVVDMARKAWDLSLAVNLTGPFLMSRHLVPLMPAGSAIVNVSTIGAVRAVPDSDAYVASKGGLIALSKAMAISLAGRGIRVNAVCPGVFGNEEVQSHMDNPRLQAMLPRSAPIGRGFGEPPELASVVEFLCGPGASFINGAVLNVDGGAVC